MNLRKSVLTFASSITILTLASCIQPASTAVPSNTPSSLLPSPPSVDPAQALRDAQAALESAGGHTITVEQSNFVLPQWGGSDGGVVHVSCNADSATAELDRTGEGGPYMIVFANDQTFFRRATCQSWARIPGGGRDVLRPFLLAKTKALASAGNPVRVGAIIHARIDGIGDADIQLDARSTLPISISSDTATNNGKFLHWQFSNWGEPVTVSAPDQGYVDRGPGGNPC